MSRRCTRNVPGRNVEHSVSKSCTFRIVRHVYSVWSPADFQLNIPMELPPHQTATNWQRSYCTENENSSIQVRNIPELKEEYSTSVKRVSKIISSRCFWREGVGITYISMWNIPSWYRTLLCGDMKLYFWDSYWLLVQKIVTADFTSDKEKDCMTRQSWKKPKRETYACLLGLSLALLTTPSWFRSV